MKNIDKKRASHYSEAEVMNIGVQYDNNRNKGKE